MDGVVSSHSYRASVGGQVLAEISVGDPSLLDEPTMASYLVAYEGHVSGVLFEPKPEIRIRRDNQTLRFSATLPDVERALTMRGETVTIYASRSESTLPRLVHITHRGRPPRRPSLEDRRSHVLERWRPVLERLAE